MPTDQPAPLMLTLNGGSSSIKFAVFSQGQSEKRKLWGQIERIGQSGAKVKANFANQPRVEEIAIDAADHHQAAIELLQWLEKQVGGPTIGAVGHRVVHGGIHLTEHQIITPGVLETLRQTQLLDMAHLPREIALIEAVAERHPAVPQVACFDTVFHRDMPRVAQLLPIPRKYDAAGLRRFGFHGISYAYLMEELRRVAGPAADGRVILAHLGSGASMAAVKGGLSVDTTMGFTPLAGLVMGTRPGDLDPGLLAYLLRAEHLSPDELDNFLNQDCGLKGISETAADMRDLAARRATDPRAAEAIDLFCYRARQWIGALAAAMGGLDAIVFAGGIGEHAPDTRQQICRGLEFLGIQIDPASNQNNSAVISPDGSPVTIRVIATDEEIMIARTVTALLKPPAPA